MSPILFIPIAAQFLISTTGQAADAVRALFVEGQPAAKLSCSIQPVHPRLGFSLLHWSGFQLTLPLRKNASPRYGVAIQVTPEGGEPLYLADQIRMQELPEGRKLPRGAALDYMGGFYAGPGEYRVRVVVGDIVDAQCRKDWKIKVKPAKIAGRVEPGQISAVGQERWPGLATGEPARHITVVVEAAPLAPRRNMVRLSSYDRGVLLSTLTSVLDTTRATSATVIAVDPRNRKEIFRTERFGRRDLFRLSRAMAEVNLGVVSLETLQGPSAAEFLESVLASLESPRPQPEAVIFLGTVWNWRGKLTPRLRELARTLPNPYFLGLSRIVGVADSLPMRAIDSAGGTVKVLFTPDDLVKALARIADSQTN